MEAPRRETFPPLGANALECAIRGSTKVPGGLGVRALEARTDLKMLRFSSQRCTAPNQRDDLHQRLRLRATEHSRS
jgi:hypothetical protein